MQRVFHKLLAFCLILAMSLGAIQFAYGQSKNAQITAFDKDGSIVDSLIDGNQISI